MSDPALLARAADPATPLDELAALAQHHPHVRATVALNPSAYEGLLEWLGMLGDAEVDRALRQRRGEAEPEAPAAPALVPEASAPTRWAEPSRLLPLRWGPYGLRYGLTLGLLIAVLVVPWGAFVAPEIEGGWSAIALRCLVAIVAVAAAPATVGRRVGAGVLLVVGIVGSFGQLILEITAGLYSWGVLGQVLSVASPLLPVGLFAALGAWFVLRSRSGLSLVLLPAVVVHSLIVRLTFGYVLGMSTSSGFFGGVTVLEALIHLAFLASMAWAAYGITRARFAARNRAPRIALSPEQWQAQQEAAAHAARVAHIQQWEAAYRDAHGGQEPPPGAFIPR